MQSQIQCSTGLQIQPVKFISRQTERSLNFVNVMKTFASKVQKKHETDTGFCTEVVLNPGPSVLDQEWWMQQKYLPQKLGSLGDLVSHREIHGKGLTCA